MAELAGGATAQPPPFWLIIATAAIFVGFLVAYGDSLPSISGSFACDSSPLIPYSNCVSSAATMLLNIITIVFKVVTLGGFTSPLPLYIHAPVALLLGLAWGPYIVQAVVNIAAAFIP